MRWLKRSLAVVAALFLVLVGTVLVIDWIETRQSDRFYVAHPMLREMRDAPRAQSRPNDPWPQMTEVLLRRVPIGSSIDDAVRVLETEGMHCEQTRAGNLVCAPLTRPSHVARWYIEVKLDQTTSRVSGGRALMLKVTT